MTYITMYVHDEAIYCDLMGTKDDSHIAHISADKDGDRWLVNSSSHPNADSINDFDASDCYIASPLVLNMMRRLKTEIEWK